MKNISIYWTKHHTGLLFIRGEDKGDDSYDHAGFLSGGIYQLLTHRRENQSKAASLSKRDRYRRWGNQRHLEFAGHSLEKAMAPHSSTVAWKIPWMEEPGRLQSMRSLRVGHDWATSLSLSTFMHWRRKWQPTPVFLHGESQGQRSLVGCSPWGRTESDTTKATQQYYTEGNYTD